MSKIQFRRGQKANIPVLNEGEPAFTTDTNEIFIGSKDGDIQLAKKSEVASTNHHSTHEAGGQDELDIVRLKNYVNNVETHINVLIGLNDYSTYLTYTSSGNIATETVKDNSNTVISTTTYSYENDRLKTTVFTVNEIIVTSTFNYDSNGNITSVVNTKS